MVRRALLYSFKSLCLAAIAAVDAATGGASVWRVQQVVGGGAVALFILHTSILEPVEQRGGDFIKFTSLETCEARRAYQIFTCFSESFKRVAISMRRSRVRY